MTARKSLTNEKAARAEQFVVWFSDTGIEDIPPVGGKNASLGEMIRHLTAEGVRVPIGFATTAYAYQEFSRRRTRRSLSCLLHEIWCRAVRRIRRDNWDRWAHGAECFTARAWTTPAL